MSAQDLESALREGGEKVGEGRIRIDSARALQRLKDFRFADPSHWVLEVLRAATLSYAKKVEVRTDADDVEISFDGKSFPTDSMKTLLEQALNAANTPDEKRTRLLSLGVAGALGVTASFVKVSSGGVALTLSGDEVQVEETRTKGTHLHLRKAFGWRVAAAFFRGSPEARAIAESAKRFPATLELNGEVVKAPAQRQVGHKIVDGKGFRLEARLPLGPPLRTSRIEIDVAGVVVAEREKRLPGVQLEAWLRADDMRRNASGSDVVDDDEIFEAAMLALRKVSRDLLNELGEKLAADEPWKVSFKEQLKDEASLDPQVKKMLHKLPLFIDPASQGLSLDEILSHQHDRSVIYIAKSDYPKGSFPEGTVLLAGERYTSLLPQGRQLDVSEIVKSKRKVALARARHEALEVEEAVLPARNWVAKGKLDATAVSGEVGFEAGGNGAFVRVLHKGRLMESGELTALAPLRLRAVVDWERPLADSFFSTDEGASKLLGLVLKYVEHAAMRAICDALPKPEVLPHALDLLTRLAVNRNVPFNELPKELKAAPLLPCLEGEPVSLDTIYAEKTWRWVDRRRPHGLLEGGRVLVLGPALRDVLKKFGPKKLEDVGPQLFEEEEVRRRLAGPKTVPELDSHVGAKVKIAEEGMRGEVGIPTLPGTKLMVSLIKSGFLLEMNEHPARYNRAIASIDCDSLRPNESWNGAVRDDAFKRVMSAIHDAQRKLAVELVKEKRSQWKFGADQYFVAFLKKELVPFNPDQLDEVTRAVANAPVFESMHGPRTLMQLHEHVKRHGRLYVMSARRDVPSDFEVIVELPAVAEVLGEALGTKPVDPQGALAALEARQRLQALPLSEFRLPSQGEFEVRHTEARFTVLASLKDGFGEQASGVVYVDGRIYSQLLVPCSLPLEFAIDAPTFEPNTFRELTAEQRLEAVRLVSTAMQLVVKKALDAPPDDPRASRVLLIALARSLETVLPAEHAERLVARPLFPCTDGKLRSYRDLDEVSPQYVRSEMEGELPNRRAIMVATDAPVLLALIRWPHAQNVEDELQLQLTASRARAQLARVEEVVSKEQTPWRQRVQERDLTGEIVVTHKNPGRLELFLDKKPLCVLPNALPPPLAGAIDSPRFTPMPGFKGVVHDDHLTEAIEALTGAGERLAAKLASAPRVLELEEALVQLAFWVGSTLAWQWKGKKKGKSGGKKKEVETKHELMAKKLLRANDSTLLSVQDLIEQQREAGHVDVTRQGGTFLQLGRRAWWPRGDEQKWAEALGFTWRDVTTDVQFAESIRQRPKYETIESPLAGEWRERVQGAGLDGEVAIGSVPDGKLIIHVLHQRMLIETWFSEHPVGGVARVDSSQVTPNEQWTSVKRDADFKALVTATEAALERLLVRRLAAPNSRQFAFAAVKWRSGQAGPLGGVVPSLELFKDLKGAAVTVGAVFELARKKGKVPVANPFFNNEASGVVHDSPETRALLALLELQAEDVTGELKRAKDLQQALTSRRLQSLTWKGGSLVKVTASTLQLKGELAIQSVISQKSDVTLAKDGIAVCSLEDRWPGVVGVIDVKDLSVNDDWTSAEPTRAQRNLIREQVERLFTELAVKAPTYSNDERELAAYWALRFLLDEGTKTASELPRLKGVSAELANAPLFLTVDGERVSLRAVAEEVNARERVSVLPRSVGKPSGVVSCVLDASSMGAPWLGALEELFGKTKVWRVTNLDEWKQANREADPPEGAPELQGLRFLRREVRLLRAGALGHLTPDDLEDVKLSRSGGDTAMRYDKRRKLALLDPEHPDIARALKEAQQRPERLWVLIASIFGLVNRELTHVTDAHEAQLLLALAGHLATNPKLLPTEPS